MRLLVTGAASGIGRYLRETFGAEGLTRETGPSDLQVSERAPFDAIVHCAFNSAREISARDLLPYFRDNVLLTEKLTRVPHRKFILFSTSDVYPRQGGPHREDLEIRASEPRPLHPLTKLLSEAYVRERCASWVILRPSTLLGLYARPNTLTRILRLPRPHVGLTKDSLYNVVLYRDVADFLRLCLEEDRTGTFNLAATGDFELGELAGWIGKTVEFGDVRYRAAPMDNQKARALLPALGRSSWQKMLEFAREWGAA